MNVIESNNTYIRGTVEDDFICGGDTRNVIRGLAGDDIIYGAGGSDRLIGGTGDDVVYGGAGDDMIIAYGGADELYGGTGNDTMLGGYGADVMYGEAGADTLSGGFGTDDLNGGENDDRIIGGKGADQLAGDAGDDKLFGGWGTDKIDGGDGDDILFGGYAADTLVGGEGTDTFYSSDDDTVYEDDAPSTGANCDETAALFVTAGSANAGLADPEVNGTCDGDDVVVTSNGIPDYTYIETSPGSPRAGNYTFTIPATPTMADEVTAVPDLGTAAVALNGVPIYGPTEGTGGDVLSLEGALSECGSHNGPTGFHIHQILTSADTDCLFTPAEVAEAPQLVGYAFDGYPIYTGIDQYTSSWELTNAALFATDTWAAHSYVEGSGDLDQCNGLTDADGNYAYYTTETFPYVIGCYSGAVDITAAGGGGGR